MNLQWKARSVVRRLLKSLGIYVVVGQKGPKDYVLVDKFFWEAFFRNDPKLQLYSKGIDRAGNQWSDNIYKQFRRYSLQNLVEHVQKRRLLGDFAECGTWKGHSAYIIASILTRYNYDGTLHIFDAFEGGHAQKHEKDRNLRVRQTEKQIERELVVFKSSEEEVKDCLKEFQFIKLYKGWIPERFYEVEDRRFSFVHIDVDLYQAVLDSLTFFYPRMVEEGVIICDGYGISQFPGVKKAVDEFFANHQYKMFYEVPMGSCFIVK